MSSDPSERERALDILTNYDLDMEELALLADMPEELLTAETIPHLLNQIREHRDPGPEPPSPPPTQCPSGGTDLVSLPTYSSTSSHHTLPACAAPAPGPSHWSQDPPTTEVLPKVSRICFKITHPKLPAQVQPPTAVPLPVCLSDYQGKTPDEYPYTCSLCCYQAASQAEWLAHLNLIRHVRGKGTLHQRYPHWFCNGLKNVEPMAEEIEEHQKGHVKRLEVYSSENSTSESSSSMSTDRSSQRKEWQHGEMISLDKDLRMEAADVKLPVGSSDLRTTRPRDANHSSSSTTLLVSQPRRYNYKVYGYRINNREEEEPRRRRRRESSSDEEDQYRGKIEGSRKRRHEDEIGERGNSRGERLGRYTKRKESSGEGSMKRRRRHEEEEKHERKTEENRERRSREDKEEDQDGRNNDEKKVEEKSAPVQQLPNSPTVLNKKGLEDEDEEEGEKPVPPKEPSANSNQILSETTTSAEQQVCSNTDPVKNVLETSNHSRGEKKEVKEQENKRVDSKTPDPGITQSVTARDEQQTGMDLGSISAEEPQASRSESQNETPETPSRQGQRRKASAAPAMTQVPTTTRRSARIHGAPPPEPDPQPEHREALPKENPRVGEGSRARGAKKDPSPVVVGDLPQKMSEGQKLIQKSSAAETVQQAKNEDEDDYHDEETPDPVVMTKASAVDLIEERSAVRLLGNRGRGRGHPSLLRSKEPVARWTRGGRSSGDPTEPNTMDTETNDEACQKAGDAQEEDPTEATPMKKKKTESTVEFPVSEVVCDAHKVISGSSANIGEAPPPERIGKIVSRLDKRGAVPQVENHDLVEEKEKGREPVESIEKEEEEGAEMESCDLVPPAQKEEVKMHTEPMENSVEPHVKVLESKEVVVEPREEPLQLRWEPLEQGQAVPEPNVDVLPSESVLVVELGEEAPEPKMVLVSEKLNMEPGMKPPEPVKYISEDHVKVLHSEYVLVVETGEEVLEPKRLLESEKSVVGLGTGSLQPGEEPESGKGLPEADIKVLESEDLVAEPGAEPSRPPQSWEESLQPGKEVLELNVNILPSESVLVVELGEELPEPKMVLKSENAIMEPRAEPPQPEEVPPHLGEGSTWTGEEVSESDVKVLQSESVLGIELREEVSEAQRVLESEKVVIELGAEQPQPGKEEPKMGDAAPAGQEAGSAKRHPELEEVDVSVGTEFIQPVTGFFCSLCHVFYVREEEAKGAHCRSPSHRRMVQAHAASNL